MSKIKFVVIEKNKPSEQAVHALQQTTYNLAKEHLLQNGKVS